MSRFTPLCSILCVLAACGTPPEDYSEAFPDERLLVNMAGSASAARVSGESSEYEAATRDVATDVNGFVGAVTDAVKQVASYEPTWKDGQEDTALWGPWTDEGADGQLWVNKDKATGSYTWALEVRVTGDEAWSQLAVGEFTPDGSGRGNGTGSFFFDFDVAYAVDPGEMAGGQAYVGYTVDEDDATVEVILESIDGTDVSDLDAAYQYVQAVDGSEGSMDLAFRADATGDPAVLELVILRSRWLGDGSGRGDAYVTEGDVGELVYTASECWDAAAILTYTEDNSTLERTGDIGTCAFAESEWNEEAPVI